MVPSANKEQPKTIAIRVRKHTLWITISPIVDHYMSVITPGKNLLYGAIDCGRPIISDSAVRYF